MLGEEQMQEQEDARGLVPEERPLVFTFLENKSRITADESRQQIVSPEASKNFYCVCLITHNRDERKNSNRFIMTLLYTFLIF